MTPAILAELRQLQADLYVKMASSTGSAQRPIAAREEVTEVLPVSSERIA